MVPMVTVLVLLAALGTIAGLVLRGAHEIHRPVAGVVLVAVLAPVLRVTRRHVQIDRLHRHRLSHHHRHGDYRLRVEDRRSYPGPFSPTNSGWTASCDNTWIADR